MLFANLQAEITQSIQSVEAQIAQLQQQLHELQAHQQQVGSVETACESALTQIDTALAMLAHVCPDQVGVFQEAIASRFNASLPQLPEAVDPVPTPEPPQPIEPDPVIEIEAEVVEVATAPENGNGKKDSLLNYKDLKSVDRATLLKLACQHDIPKRKDKKRDELAQILDGMVTESELAAAMNGNGKK